MGRHLLFLLLVALCALQSVAPKRHQKEVENAEAEDAKVMVDAVEDHEDEVDDDDVDDRDLDEEEEDEEEEEEEDEEFTGDLPFHPVNDVADPALQDLIIRSRRPSCSYRKCTRFYRGWWSTEGCPTNSRAVAYCRRNGKWCCAICKAKDWCTAKGGICMMEKRCPPDWLKEKSGCFGKWWCCSPPSQPSP